MLNALDMFNVGIGPSSSHTIGPMKAALSFVTNLKDMQNLDNVRRIQVHLYGSLALTGKGHGTVLAVLNGLSGENPKTVASAVFIGRADEINRSKEINILALYKIPFNIDEDIVFHKAEVLPEHANGMSFNAMDSNGELLFTEKYFSIGGGFILNETQMKGKDIKSVKDYVQPYPFRSAAELFGLCNKHGLSVAQLVLENELVRKSKTQVYAEALEIIDIMHNSIKNGLMTEGVLPGSIAVRRRAPGLYRKLYVEGSESLEQTRRLLAMTYAMAVNEENAAFGRIVTAPTNGAAGTIPGVLEYYRNFCVGATEEKMIEFILTAGAIGMLYKFGASISAAEVGCQGEIGVACSMASGALAAVLGGSLVQVANAAEIAMEHNLGMTCDPVLGLVQIPCIERNGVAASKAIDIARLALLENQPGKISLDSVIKTMLQTGKDMSMHYKETSLGGLAVNVINC